MRQKITHWHIFFMKNIWLPRLFNYYFLIIDAIFILGNINGILYRSLCDICLLANVNCMQYAMKRNNAKFISSEFVYIASIAGESIHIENCRKIRAWRISWQFSHYNRSMFIIFRIVAFFLLMEPFRSTDFQIVQSFLIYVIFTNKLGVINTIFYKDWVGISS